MQTFAHNSIANPFLLPSIIGHPPCQSMFVPQDAAVVVPTQMKTPSALKGWYHPLGQLAKESCAEGFLKEENLRQKFEVDSQTCNMILSWLRVKHSSFHALSIQDLLGFISRHTCWQRSGSLWLHGGVVDDWLKRILPWNEIFERLGVRDTVSRTALIKRMEESVNPDSSQIMLQLRMTVPPQQNGQEVLQRWALNISMDELQPDLSRIHQEVVLYALGGMGYFPRQMTPVEVPLQLELVTERENFSHPSCLSIAIDLNQESIRLTVPAELVWKTALSDWSRQGLPRNEQEFLSLVEGYTLLEQRCLTPNMRDMWVDWFSSYAGQENADPTERISRWIKEFMAQRYEKRPLAEITLRYQVSRMLLGYIPEAELSRLWSFSRSIARWPDSLHKIMIQALAKDQMLLSGFDSLLQIVGAVVVGFTMPNADSCICLDYSDGKDCFRIRCGAEGSILVAAHLSEAMERVARDLIDTSKDTEKTEKVLADILRCLAPCWGAGVDEAIAYLRTLGLEPESTVALAEQCLASQEPIICHFGYLLYELFYWQNPSAGRGMNLFLRLPIALKGLQGEARFSLLQRIGKLIKNTPYECLEEILKNMPSSDWEVPSYWIRALMGTSRSDCKKAAITLWKKIDDPKGLLGLRIIPFADFLSSFKILLELEKRLNPSEFLKAVGMVLNKRPRKPDLEEKLALSNLLKKYPKQLFPFLQQWNSSDFLELLDCTEPKFRFNYLLDYEIAQEAKEAKEDGSSLGNIWPSTFQAACNHMGQKEVWKLLLQAQAKNLKLEKLFPKADQETVTQSLDQVIPQEYSPIAAALLMSVRKNFDSKQIHDFCTLRLGNYLENLLEASPAPGNQLLQEAFDQFCSGLPIVRQRDLLRRLAELWLQRKYAVLATQQLLKLLKISPTEPSAEELDLAVRVIRFQITVDPEPARSLLHHNRLKDRLPIELWWEACEAESLRAHPRPTILVELLRQLHASQADRLRLALIVVAIVDKVADRWPLPDEALQPLVTALREEKDSSRLFRLLEVLMSHKQAIDVDTKDLEWAILQAADVSKVDGARLARLAKYCQVTDAAVANAITGRFLQQAMPVQAEEWLGLCPSDVQAQLSLEISGLFFDQGAYEDCYRLLPKLSDEAIKTRMQQILDAADAHKNPKLVLQILIQKGTWAISANRLAECKEALVKSKVSGTFAEGLLSLLKKYPMTPLYLWRKIWSSLDRNVKAPVIEDLFQVFLQNEVNGWESKSESELASCWQLAIQALSRVNSFELVNLLKEPDCFKRFESILKTPTEAIDNTIKTLFENVLLYAIQAEDTGEIRQIAQRLTSLDLDWDSQHPHHKEVKVQLFLQIATAIYRFEIEDRFPTASLWMERVFHWLQNRKGYIKDGISDETSRHLFTLIDIFFAREASDQAEEDAHWMGLLAKKYLDPQIHFRYFFRIIHVILLFKNPRMTEFAGALLQLCLRHSGQFPEISRAVCEQLKICKVASYRDIIFDKLAVGFISESQLKADRLHLLEEPLIELIATKDIEKLATTIYYMTQFPPLTTYLIENVNPTFIRGICLINNCTTTEDDMDEVNVEDVAVLPQLQLFFKAVQKIDPNQVSIFSHSNATKTTDPLLAYSVATMLLKFPWQNRRLRRRIHYFIGHWIISFMGQRKAKQLPEIAIYTGATLITRAWALIGVMETDPKRDHAAEVECDKLAKMLSKFFEITKVSLFDPKLKIEYHAAALCVGANNTQIDSAILATAFDYLLASPSGATIHRTFELLDQTLRLIQETENHDILSGSMEYVTLFCDKHPLLHENRSLAWGFFEFLVRYRTLLENLTSKEKGLIVLQSLMDRLLQAMLDGENAKNFLEDFCAILEHAQGRHGLPLPITLSFPDLVWSMLQAIYRVQCDSFEGDVAKLLDILKYDNSLDQFINNIKNQEIQKDQDRDELLIDLKTKIAEI